MDTSLRFQFSFIDNYLDVVNGLKELLEGKGLNRGYSVLGLRVLRTFPLIHLKNIYARAPAPHQVLNP
jgi:hypothetical protein